MKPFYLGNNINRPSEFPLLVTVQSKRFWDDNTQWPFCNPADGTFQWKQIDNWIKVLTAAGITDALYVLGRTPTWASQDPTNTGCVYSKYGTPGECAPPLGLNLDGTGMNMCWRRWLAALGQHLTVAAPNILFHFEPWNEFTNHPASWAGNYPQLVRLSEDARAILLGRGKITATGETVRDALKSVGLTAPAYRGWPSSASTAGLSKFTSPSSNGGYPQFAEYLAKPGATEAAEIINIHPYAPTSAKAYKNVIACRNHLTGVNLTKPIWAGEGSWEPTHEPQEADDVYVKGWLTQLYSVCDRVYWYAHTIGTTSLAEAGQLTLAGQAWEAWVNNPPNDADVAASVAEDQSGNQATS